MKLITRLLILTAISLTAINTAQSQAKGNFKKKYDSDCAKCADEWVGTAYYKTWGICPSGSGGQNAECNIYNWNNASWNDYNHLTNIIRNKYTGARASGNVYIFIKPENVDFKLGKAGHIGWAFQLSDGSLYCGATENYSASYFVPAMKDNDFWAEKCETDRQMFALMKATGYSQYKVLNVKNPNILAAKLASEAVQQKGFQGVSNNCLDHTYTILSAYGLNYLQLPSRQVYLFPNKWFNEFYQNENGNGVYGKNL